MDGRLIERTNTDPCREVGILFNNSSISALASIANRIKN